MTIKNDIALWDNGTDTFCLGYEVFTLFDRLYIDILDKIETVNHFLNGTFRIYDVGADTDGYIDFEMNNSRVLIKGQLGATLTYLTLRTFLSFLGNQKPLLSAGQRGFFATSPDKERQGVYRPQRLPLTRELSERMRGLRER